MGKFNDYLNEKRDPEDIDGPEDLPAKVEDALPDGAESMFYTALKDAMEEKPDAQEGVWYAMAWDEVNDNYKKDSDGKWIEKDKKSQEESILDRADSFLERAEQYG